MMDFLDKLDFYIQAYDFNKQIYNLGKEIKNRGWIEKEEFLLICLWKSRRPKRLYYQNEANQIKRITKKAFSTSKERKRIKFLIELKGVNIPTASAILSVWDPNLYPIIDIRCINSLKDLGYINWTYISLNSWIEYLSIIREIADRNKLSAREIEKGLFAYNRIKLDKEYRNLYKY
jgi:hypothetical protein